MPGEKGGVNEQLGEGAYGRVRGGGEGCLAAMVSAQAEADLETKLRRGGSEHVFCPTNEGQSVTNMSVFSKLYVQLPLLAR